MSREIRRELLDTLMQVSDEFPEWRLGQMLTNLALARSAEPESIWDAEDEELLQAANELLASRREAIATT